MGRPSRSSDTGPAGTEGYRRISESYSLQAPSMRALPLTLSPHLTGPKPSSSNANSLSGDLATVFAPPLRSAWELQAPSPRCATPQSTAPGGAGGTRPRCRHGDPRLVLFGPVRRDPRGTTPSRADTLLLGGA